MISNKKTNYQAFTLMELIIVLVIIGIFSAVGIVMFGGQAEKAKIAATKANFRNVQKFLDVEFFKCQIDSSEIIFNTHKCSDSNPPSISLIVNYLTSKLGIKNPYKASSSAISSNPCTLGTVSITSPSTGAYSLNYYSSLAKKITTAHIGTTWVPVKISVNNTWTPVNTGCKNTWKKVNVNANNIWAPMNP